MSSVKLFEHCSSVYAMMDAVAEVGGDGVTKYASVRGTELVSVNLGLSHSYYSTIFTALKQMGCIEQYERGVAGRPSTWKLNFAPTWETFGELAAQGKIRGEGATPQYVAQMLTSLASRVSTLESDISSMKAIISFFATRLEELSPKSEDNEDER